MSIHEVLAMFPREYSELPSLRPEAAMVVIPFAGWAILTRKGGAKLGGDGADFLADLEGSSGAGPSKALIVVWFAATLLFNYMSCQLMNFTKAAPPLPARVTPEDVTLVEMLICTVCGTLTLLACGLPLLPPRRVRGSLLAVSCANLVACRLFMMALARIPISLVQTVRACQPLFVMIICYVALGKRYPAPLYACVATICAGFSLAALGDVTFDGAGFAMACVSVSMLCVVNMLVQRVVTQNDGADGGSPKLHPKQLQAWVTSGSFLVLLPIWAGGAGPARLAALLSDAPYAQRFAKAALLDGLTYHAANLGTFTAVSQFSPLAFAVVDTVRRLCVVCSGFVYQGNPCSGLNLFGVLLVFAGSGAYNWQQHGGAADGGAEEQDAPPL